MSSPYPSVSGKQIQVLFIDAVHDVARERAQSFLKAEHQQRILTAYQAFTDDPGFAKVATATEILQKDGNLSIPRPANLSLGTMVENLLLEPRTASFGTEIGSPQDVGKPLARHRGSLLLPVLH